MSWHRISWTGQIKGFWLDGGTPRLSNNISRWLGAQGRGKDIENNLLEVWHGGPPTAEQCCFTVWFLWLLGFVCLFLYCCYWYQLPPNLPMFIVTIKIPSSHSFWEVVFLGMLSQGLTLAGPLDAPQNSDTRLFRSVWGNLQPNFAHYFGDGPNVGQVWM